jgi:hypothetical protein
MHNPATPTRRSASKTTQLLLIPLFLSLLASACAPAAEGGPGEGTDVEIGGPGSGPGEFLELRDLAFGPDNRLYVLEGRQFDNQTKQWLGNCRVQVFSPRGEFLAQFPIATNQLNEKCDPSRLAVTDSEHVFITEPATGVVLQYGPGPWALLKTYAISNAFAIATWKTEGRERVGVLGRRYFQNKWQPFDRLEVIEPGRGDPVPPLRLSRGVAGVMDLAADAQGNLHVVAEVNQLYKFSPAGQLLTVLGSGTWRRTADGSELRHSVALDAEGRIYSQAWGQIARFTAALKTVTLQPGQFYWYDNWSPHDAYTPMAIDRQGRFWLGATGKVEKGVRHHYRPAVVRAKEDFFNKALPQSTLALGFDPVIKTTLPYQIAYDLSPIALEYVLPRAFRQLREAVVEWHVYDVLKTDVAKDSFPVKLEDDVEVRQSFQFNPPAYGWYTIECLAKTPAGEAILGVGLHLGVTPKFNGLPVLAEGHSPGGWVDPARLAFTGLRLMRLHTQQGADTIEKALAGAEKYGLTVIVQFQDREHCKPEQVREFVTRFKGRVKFWEIINEPNFSFKPEEYAELLKQVGPIIKQIDPPAQVMGPAVCGINLGWHEAFFKAGGAKGLDMISIHDYEGNESIDPGHWRWKIGQLRDLMGRYGLGDKPLWQTERAIGGVRADTFLGGVQAVRVTLQRDVLETLGIPNEHNLHYYLNQAGYRDVPTYLWSASGPHPAALALRTREAMVLGRHYTGTLDFGPDGNRIFMALRYEGTDGSTIVLRQLGAAEEPALRLGVRGGEEVEVVDSFGNRRRLPVREGTLTLQVPLLPVYLRLAKAQEVTPPQIAFGRHLAPEAAITYSGKTKSSMAILTNGLLECTHAATPWGPYWAGELTNASQSLELAFPTPQTINRMVLHSVRADNPHCYLVDFDVQWLDGQTWKTLKEVRTPLPASDLVRTADAKANTWYMDQNFALVEFPPVRTDKLRIVARRSTFGFHPDATATSATGWKANQPTLHLREIQLFAPEPAP